MKFRSARRSGLTVVKCSVERLRTVGQSTEACGGIQTRYMAPIRRPNWATASRRAGMAQPPNFAIVDADCRVSVKRLDGRLRGTRPREWLRSSRRTTEY